MIFKGAATAIVTPFDNNSNVNYVKLKELIEFQISNGIKAIVVCGTTGEASTLTNEEKKEVIRYTVKIVNKRVPVIAGTGTNNTAYSIELSKCAEKLNVDGLLLVTPYYNKCTQEGLYLHYSEIANSVNLPIILYNVPSRTSVNIAVDTVVRLSKIPNIVGIKEASSNLSQIAEILSKVDETFSLYSGNDDQILPILSLGGKGVISVISNILPKETNKLCELYFNNDTNQAKLLQLKYLKLIKSLFVEVNPIPIKECMNILGYNVGGTRLPLSKMSDTNIQILKDTLKEFNLI
ncbi:MAG: 4-hydroxy-tetrahydrodipicolinate synthase [Clostridia bacterium]|nr:4-hydroxy-tetrahydrodipicolinate synthase [Clostridia bacterium]MDD4387431.1 4-hydroxy-tetrahydrodipicolinate synthase [Clostridia bacterium]